LKWLNVSKVFQDAKVIMHSIKKPVMKMSGFAMSQALSIRQTFVSLVTDKGQS
jgi:hypothetical protein